MDQEDARRTKEDIIEQRDALLREQHVMKQEHRKQLAKCEEHAGEMAKEYDRQVKGFKEQILSLQEELREQKLVDYRGDETWNKD